MNRFRFPISIQGFPLIFFFSLSAIVFSILDLWIIAIIFWIFTYFTIHFFRDPERVIPQIPNIAVSPADGKIVKIERRPDPFSHMEKTCISVFMNVFNVHVNRSPVEGSVQEISYIPGKFINASLDKASEDNERCVWQINSANESWTVVQIAGLIARRIVPGACPGERLTRGERFGMIKFGSRVDVYLPDSYIPAVAMGEKVLAGESIIARKE